MHIVLSRLPHFPWSRLGCLINLGLTISICLTPAPGRRKKWWGSPWGHSSTPHPNPFGQRLLMLRGVCKPSNLGRGRKAIWAKRRKGSFASLLSVPFTVLSSLIFSQIRFYLNTRERRKRFFKGIGIVWVRAAEFWKTFSWRGYNSLLIHLFWLSCVFWDRADESDGMLNVKVCTAFTFPF